MTVFWIGLTGAIGSGKSQVAACFANLDVPIIDADAIARQLTNTPNSLALQQIQAIFGTQALDGTGKMDRDYMRQLIFSQPDLRLQLESILHPLILQEIQQQQAQNQSAPYGIIEIPTLIENPIFQKLVQRILVVICRENTRIERIKQRSGLTEMAIRAIIETQASDEQRLALANDIIKNDGNMQDLSDQVQMLHQYYCQIVR